MIRKPGSLVLLAAFFLLPYFAFSQCIVINELLIDGASQFDGQNAPNTEEWIELYNTCDEPVDVSCWAIADGDFVVRFPQGTIIQPQDHFVIGSVNSDVPVDLFPATCNCATPLSATIIFTNGGEQLVLIDNNGVIQDGVIWGGGQSIPFTGNNSSGGCTSITTPVTMATAQFESLPFVSGSAGQGCTYARTCDGNTNWEIRCGNEITGGTTNGPPVTVDFDAVSSFICVGECTDFYELCEGDISLYGWTFDGGQPAIQYGPNVTACYDTPGTYYVTLTVQSSCGSQILEALNFITVYDNTVPVIIGGEQGSYCSGESVPLSTSATGTIQWLFNNQVIPGANASTYSATLNGDYSVQISNASCNNVSENISLIFNPQEEIIITAASSTALCEGESVVLSTTFSGPYQWLNNNNPIPGAISSTLEVNGSGMYSLSSPNNSCINNSNVIEVTAFAENPPVISANSMSICPGSSTVLTVPDLFDSYTWILNNSPLSGEVNSELTTNTPGDYAVEVSIGGCVLTAQTITIEPGQIPTVNISSNDDIPACPDTEVTIEANGNFASISWLRDNSPLPNTTNSITTSIAGNYSAEVLSADGCATLSNALSVSFLTISIPVIESSEGLSICADAFTDLSVPADYLEYNWFQNGSAIGNNSATLSQVGPGVYAVELENQNGCIISSSLTINAIALPNVNLQPNGTVVTCDDSFTFNVSGANNYMWYFNGEVFASNTSTIQVTEAGSYYVIGTTGTCSGQSQTANLSFEESITVEIAATDTLVCEGENIHLSVPAIYTNYLWSNGATTPSTEVSTTMDIEVEVTDNNGCRGASTISVEVVALPEITLESSFESDCAFGAEVRALSNGLISWQINPYLTIIDSITALFNPPFTTDFKLTSTIGNCMSEQFFRINADCSTLFVPNTITPNGDGINDVFKVSLQGVYTFELIIFDRWGNEVFKSNDPDEAWTGGVNEYYVQDGAYTYMIKALDRMGIPITRDEIVFGTIHVLR